MAVLMSMKFRGSIDDALIAKSAAGDRQAREQLASACLPRVWRTVYLSCKNKSDVEDLVQNAMAQAFSDLSGFGQKGNFDTWLSRVTVNVIRKYYRRKAYTALLPFSHEMDTVLPPDTTTPERRAEARRLLESLSSHLERLKPKNRIALVLSLVEGYSLPEIALVLSCSVEAARKRLFRGRQALVIMIQKDPYCRQILKELLK
jgi:RNA polymerase sigma-70 factor (ECF subfamily)